MITPTSALAVLPVGQAVLDAVSGDQAWVVGVTPSQRTVVFGTKDGGRSWWRSLSIAADEPVAVAFAGPSQGWLLESMGAAMSQNPVRLYRSSDGGLSWALVARSAQVPGSRPTATGLPVACDKTGVAASPAARGSPAGLGWITSFCPKSLADAVLVSRDAGAHWASPRLPIPPSVCEQSGCDAIEPQFVGRTTILVICAYPDQALLLVTTDGGADWRVAIMPGGAGPYPRVRFFSQSDGIAVSAGPQGSIGRDFYMTADGGLTWTAVAQGRRFGSGASFDFVSPAAGFAWISGADSPGSAPSMYRTSDSGRVWTSFVPRLS